MTQWIKSGTVDQYVYFQGPPGLSTWTVNGSKNGAAAAAFTTPTINETSSSLLPGTYELLLDEQTTLAVSNVTESLALHISATGWSGTTIFVTLFDNLPADLTKVLGTDIAESAADNNRNIGY
jgi:hypothetical protein